MDEALKLIKSLLTTSSEGGLLVNELDKEYKEMVGTSIPFRDYGFNTLTEFLRSSNQFSGTKTPNGMKVCIKVAGKSSHIIAFRQNQNVSQADRKRRKKAMAKSEAIGGANSTMQPKQPNPKPIMRRNGVTQGAIAKPRVRVQSQLIAGFSSTVKSVAPRRQMSTQSKTNTNNNVPVNVATQNAIEPLRKGNLHARFVAKQLSECQTSAPVINLKPMVFEPSTPPQTPAKIDHESTKGQTFHETRSSRSTLMARLAPKQPASSIDSQIPNGMLTAPTPSDQHFCSSNLSARMKLKQLVSLIDSPKNEADHQSSRRDAFMRKLQQDKNEKRSMNQSEENKTVPSNKTGTRGNLHNRLAPKMIETSNGKIEHPQLSTNAIRSTTNPNDTKASVNSRLQPKQIDAQTNHMEQISQKLNDMYIMEVDANVNDSVIKPLQGIKLNLSGRLQLKQYIRNDLEMDWEQVNWVRSVKSNKSGYEVTVNFN